jgi:hypothetical protein
MDRQLRPTLPNKTLATPVNEPLPEKQQSILDRIRSRLAAPADVSTYFAGAANNCCLSNRSGATKFSGRRLDGLKRRWILGFRQSLF